MTATLQFLWIVGRQVRFKDVNGGGNTAPLLALMFLLMPLSQRKVSIKFHLIQIHLNILKQEKTLTFGINLKWVFSYIKVHFHFVIKQYYQIFFW